MAMRFSLTPSPLQSSNAAFERDDMARAELARLLRLMARQIEGGYDDNTIKDTNGNTIGEWVFEFEDEDEYTDEDRDAIYTSTDDD